MRLSAYKICIDQISKIPNEIEELKQYFQDSHSPLQISFNYILQKARNDDKLFHSEFIELYNYCKTNYNFD